MLFCAEDWTNLEDTVEPCAHEHLLVELRALVEECFLVEVCKGEEFCSAFGCGCDDLWCLYLGEVVVPEELTDRTQGCVSDQKDCVDAGLAQVKITVVEACVKICRNFFGDIQRQRGVCAGDNLEGIGDKFPSSGWKWA